MTSTCVSGRGSVGEKLMEVLEIVHHIAVPLPCVWLTGRFRICSAFQKLERACNPQDGIRRGHKIGTFRSAAYFLAEKFSTQILMPLAYQKHGQWVHTPSSCPCPGSFGWIMPPQLTASPNFRQKTLDTLDIKEIRVGKKQKNK